MKKRKLKVLTRYLLFEIPGLLLFVFILTLVKNRLDIPEGLYWILIAVWIIKDVALFPFVRKAYDTNRPEDENRLLGESGVAKENLRPSGFIRIRGELWKAEISDINKPVKTGDKVKVTGIRGLTLLVEPDE